MNEWQIADRSRRFITQGHQRHSKGGMDVAILTLSQDFPQWHTMVGKSPLGRRCTDVATLLLPYSKRSKRLRCLSFKAKAPPLRKAGSRGMADCRSFTSPFFTIQEAVMLGTRWGFIYLQKCSQGWTEVNKVYPLLLFLLWVIGSLQLHRVGLEYQTSDFIHLFIDFGAKREQRYLCRSQRQSLAGHPVSDGAES